MNERTGSERFPTLSSLFYSLRQLSLVPAADWGCFQSLHNVTISLNGQSYKCFYRYTITDAAPLLLLARLVDLRLNGLVDDAEGYSWEWKPRISSCQYLSLRPAAQLSVESVHGLLSGIESIKGCLLSENGHKYGTGIAEPLLTHGRESLDLIDVSHPLTLLNQTTFTRLRHCQMHFRDIFVPTCISAESETDLDDLRTT